MICGECNSKKEDQKYTDVCDTCVNKIMKKSWEEKISPAVKSFIQQIKQEED